MSTTSTVAIEEGQVSFEFILKPVRKHFERLDEMFQMEVMEFEPEVRDLVRYAIGNQGKRLRSALVFYSGWNAEYNVSTDLVRVACIIELVHLATLIHDDILDGAFIRRNCSTVSHKFGAKQAILLGDALFSHALKLATDFSTMDVCRVVAQSTRRVCSGEIMQTFLQGEVISPEAYYRIIDLKTAELFYASCYLGARVGGYDKAYVEGVSRIDRNPIDPCKKR